MGLEIEQGQGFNSKLGNLRCLRVKGKEEVGAGETADISVDL